MTWRELRNFCNDLPELIIDNNVMLWREDEAITDISASQLDEDSYIDLDNPEDGCFPVSHCAELEPDTKIKKVYDKGHPILSENF